MKPDTPKTKQGHILLDLINKHNTKIFAEIGVWKSHTVEIILGAKSPLQEYWGIDPWLKSTDPAYGHYHTRTQEEWDKFYLKSCRFMIWFSQYQVLRLDHEVAAKIFPKPYFDMVFLDAGHFFEETYSQIKTWLPLIKPNGILTGHGFMGQRPDVEKAVKKVFGNNFELCGQTVWMHKIQK